MIELGLDSCAHQQKHSVAHKITSACKIQLVPTQVCPTHLAKPKRKILYSKQNAVKKAVLLRFLYINHPKK